MKKAADTPPSALGAIGALKCDPGSWSRTCGCRLLPGTHTGRELWSVFVDVSVSGMVCICMCELTGAAAVTAWGFCPAAPSVSVFQCFLSVSISGSVEFTDSREALSGMSVFHQNHKKLSYKQQQFTALLNFTKLKLQE